MDTFEHLPSEKRQRIINAAMTEFATHGYQKASVSDIAKSAGISKAMVFTYFGSKSKCYEYLCNQTFRISLDLYEQTKDQIIVSSDYFERLSLLSKAKLAMLKDYPTLTKFALSMYKETAGEVAEVVEQILKKSYEIHILMTDDGLEKQKLKHPEDANHLNKSLRWIAYGCVEEWLQSGKSDQMDQALMAYDSCLVTLKKHFYKEEYLQNVSD